MLIYNTSRGQITNADFDAARLELEREGIIDIDPDGGWESLIVPREQALKLATHKTTGLPKAALLAWILTDKAYPENLADYVAMEKTVIELSSSIHRVERRDQEENGCESNP